MTALALPLLVVSSALALDFGIVRVDRQVDQSAADSAAVAGLRGLVADGASTANPYVGVCTAAQYLQVNAPRFAALTTATGWANGVGTATASGCTDATLRLARCSPGLTSSWAVFTWTSPDGSISVRIQSGYTLDASSWAQDNLPASTADNDDAAQGCDQLAIVITQRRTPGLGSLAHVGHVTSTIRSVGRLVGAPGQYAPALLALKQTGCPILQTGGSGGGSFIHVLGAVGSNGVTQPGTIHSDSDGSACTGGSNQNIFLGRATDGIVAYAAPLASNPTSPDPAKPGQISSVAYANGIRGGVISDSSTYVHGSSALNGSGGTSYPPSGRSLVTRLAIDQRYLTGVRSAVAGAASLFATTPTAANGWTTLSNCSPAQSDVDSLHLTVASRLYVDCTSNQGVVPTGAVSIPAGTVWFRSSVGPTADLSLPNANHVYVENSRNKTDALSLGSTGANFQMHTAGNVDPTGHCTVGQSLSKGIVFIKTGDIKESNGGLLRLCRTTVIMMGGGDAAHPGCLPATNGTAPTPTPCGSTAGTGQFTQTGGDIDWTAPDAYDVTTRADGSPDPSLSAGWSDPNGPEDLALWTESYGSSSSNTYNMNGSGSFNVRGVFMAPNADPFSIGGGSSLSLTNAQFVVSTLALNGNGTNLTMSVDPNAAVHIPTLASVGLVR